MTATTQQQVGKKAQIETLKRLGKYTFVRFFMLFFAVAVGIYITILIANMGGMWMRSGGRRYGKTSPSRSA